MRVKREGYFKNNMCITGVTDAELSAMLSAIRMQMYNIVQSPFEMSEEDNKEVATLQCILKALE